MISRILRLSTLPACIGLVLATAPMPAHADDERPENWKLCPVQDTIPAFANAAPTSGSSDTRADQPTNIEGDQLSGTEAAPQFEGNVSLSRGDQFLGTDKLVFDSETGKYVATGSVRYQDSGMRVIADRAEGNQEADSHDLQNVRYQLVSRRGNGGASHIAMQGAMGSLYDSTYSTCPPEDRNWELRAERIDVDTDSGMGVARNATLRVGKIPVLYVPWFPFPIDNRRRTGLLYPNIGSSGRNGFDWRQPIYLNLAPHYDATIVPRLMSKRGLQLGGEFRYLTQGGGGTLEFAYLPSDNLVTREREEEAAEFLANGYPSANRRKEDRAHFEFEGRQDLTAAWQARADVSWISDPRYLEDFSSNVEGLAP